MIHTQSKRYQIVLWATENRHGSDPALRLVFDRREDGEAALQAQRNAGSYRSGILMEWDKMSGTWDLLDRYPT